MRIERVLLVDANDTDNNYHAIILNRAGLRGDLVVCADEFEALDFLSLAEQQVPTLVLFDVHTRRMAAAEFAGRAALIAAHSPILLVGMLSGSGLCEETFIELDLLGMRNFVTKPLSSDSAHALLASDMPS